MRVAMATMAASGAFWPRMAACTSSDRMVISSGAFGQMPTSLISGTPEAAIQALKNASFCTAGRAASAAGYCLARERDPALEAFVDNIVDIYGRLQQPDGYMNS